MTKKEMCSKYLHYSYFCIEGATWLVVARGAAEGCKISRVKCLFVPKLHKRCFLHTNIETTRTNLWSVHSFGCVSRQLFNNNKFLTAPLLSLVMRAQQANWQFNTLASKTAKSKNPAVLHILLRLKNQYFCSWLWESVFSVDLIFHKHYTNKIQRCNKIVHLSCQWKPEQEQKSRKGYWKNNTDLKENVSTNKNGTYLSVIVVKCPRHTKLKVQRIK